MSGAVLPLYQCHKRVRACKIAAVANGPNGWEVIADDRSLDAIKVSPAWVERHQPRPGGYYVLYRDGYASYSPQREFEDGYTLASDLADRRELLERQLADVNRAIQAAQDNPEGV
jgi:hypothetical protein